MKLYCYGLTLLILGLDQWTKQLATRYLADVPQVDVLPFLSWRLVHNTGAAFSMVRGRGLVAMGAVGAGGGVLDLSHERVAHACSATRRGTALPAPASWRARWETCWTG